MKRAISVVLVAISLAASAAAQNNDWPKVREECAEVTHPGSNPNPNTPDVPVSPLWKRMMACGTGVFTARPVHPTVKSIVPGGGFGPGITFSQDFNRDRWQRKVEATGASSFRAFWSVDSRLRATRGAFGKNTSARDRFATDFYVNALGLPFMDFYGIGPRTLKSNVVNFRERRVVVGGDVFNPFSSWFAVGGRVEGIFPRIQGTTDGDQPSITTAFTEATAPGLTSQPNFVHYEGYVEPRRLRNKFQFDYKIGYGFFHDTESGHYSFKQFKVEGVHTFHPFGGNDRVFTISNRLTISDAGAGKVVPFYLQETLGGTDIYGRPTLRGYSDYRFRGPDLVLIQAEYNHRLWGPLGAIAFYDTGEVANRASDLSLANMKHSFGFGASLWAGAKCWFKIYVGLGSGEGVHPYFGVPKF